MQILNISVQNRPAWSFTSMTYPVFAECSVDARVSLQNFVLSVPIPMSVPVYANAALMDFTYESGLAYLERYMGCSSTCSTCSLQDFIYERATTSGTTGLELYSSSACVLQDFVIHDTLIRYTLRNITTSSSCTLEDIQEV